MAQEFKDDAPEWEDGVFPTAGEQTFEGIKTSADLLKLAATSGITLGTFVLVAFGLVTSLGRPLFEAALEKNIGQPMTKVFRPTLPDIDMMRDASLRWTGLTKEYKEVMALHGFKERDIAIHEGLGQVIPGVQDLIRMGVREAFDDATVAKFQMDEDFSFMPVEVAKKVGLSEFWSKMFWRSHWELPSILQGFEMLHRRVIKPDELDVLLRALDVMPFWREKLKDISFRPLTRVDIRRMRRAGVLSADEVKSSYLDLGYNEENAQKMTDWTETTVIETEKELSKADILRAVRIGQISEISAVEFLGNLGYDEEEAGFLIKLNISREQSSQREITRSMILKQFRYGILTRSEALGKLQGRGFASQAADNILKTFELEQAFDVRELSFGYLRTLFADKAIEEPFFRTYLSQLGFMDRDIDLIVARETKKRVA